MFRVFIVIALCLAASPSFASSIASGGSDGLLPRGVVRATEQATIAIEFSAPVRKIHFREGETFKKGAKLVEFDCRRQQSEFEAAKALHRETELVYKNNQYLRKRGAIGHHDIEISQTRVAKAAADAKALSLRLEQCNIDAPFDGSIVELSIFEHELPAPGKPFLKIIGTGSLEVELIVPSNWLVWLKQGEAFSFYAEETAKTYAATVKRIATQVDPVSQTVKIFGFLDVKAGLLSGMSGIASFPRAEKRQE